MVKNEHFRSTDTFERVLSTGLATSSQSSMFQTTSTDIPQRSIDPRAIDISSIKGRFAWEKIALGDTYIPVIFRGTTKYFCVKMLHKLLPEYPEDFIRRSSSYQYRKPIDLYVATSNELDLLNKINTQHCHWEYCRERFTTADELVRVSDFLPFYEHLRLYVKTPSTSRTTSANSLKLNLPQPQQSMQRSPDFVVHKPNAVRSSIQAQPMAIPQVFHTETLLASRPIASVPSAAPRSAKLPKYDAQPLAAARQSLQQQLALLPMQQPIATSSNSTINSKSTVASNKSWYTSTPISSSSSSQVSTTTTTTSILTANPTPAESTVSSTRPTTSRKSSVTAPEKPSTPVPKSTLASPSVSKSTSASPSVSKSTSASPSVSKSPHLHSGWLQINKLYTPYVSSSTFNHHLYKIPVSLLTFYDLLKVPSLENNSNESKDSSYTFEQTLVTPQEIELINELCLKQGIKPFSIDTKLINLSTFYHYASANILFIKELPNNEPKVSICKDWSSIVQINGGICRLRNITTLQEQTVPFIGNNLLKNFIISAQSLASASLTIPTASELEFLQLILFFSNISINLRNAKLVDIESVQKEYNVDLILLFNDKFPLNVLDYQYQGTRPATTQQANNQHDSSAATNTFAQSTPPPSPLSPPTNHIHVNPTSQLPLTSPSMSSSSNRYQKSITFHGHTMTAYICSGLGSNAQRECISIKALCAMLYPNSSIMDKLEARLLRLFRSKNINRFRPQNQQTMAFTRLVDVKEIEKHWDYIQQGMCSLSNNDGGTDLARETTPSLVANDLKASTLDKGENHSKILEDEVPLEVNKGEKRPLERETQDEIPILERLDKHARLAVEESNELLKIIPPTLTKPIVNNQKIRSDDDSEESEDDDEDGENENPRKPRRKSRSTIRIVRKKTAKSLLQRRTNRLTNKASVPVRKPLMEPIKKKIKIIRRQSASRQRTHKQSVAAWVKKYNIEDCCILLDLCHPPYETGRD